jgi:AraC-like DNA-binding protein
VDWARYWRAPDAPLEAMRAHFERHAYHRHSHETYSFGFTESGAQTFTCRGGRHRSADGTVMAFNPDDPHDGRAADGVGFTYRMVHIGPTLVADVLADVAGRPVGLPLFVEPVLAAPELSRRLAALSDALLSGAEELRRDELLAGTVRAMARATTPMPLARVSGPDAARVAARARAALEAAVAGDGPPAERAVADLAATVGSSRFAVYRSFRAAYGLSPSDYLRQCRLRAARGMLAAGRPSAEVAAVTGFADQSHLTRWFHRYFGVTPAAYQRATAAEPVGAAPGKGPAAARPTAG